MYTAFPMRENSVVAVGAHYYQRRTDLMRIHIELNMYLFDVVALNYLFVVFSM